MNVWEQKTLKALENSSVMPEIHKSNISSECIQNKCINERENEQVSKYFMA